MSITSWTNEGNGATVTAGNDLSCKTLTTTGPINAGTGQITTSGTITGGHILSSALLTTSGDLIVSGTAALRGNVTIGNAISDTVGFSTDGLNGLLILSGILKSLVVGIPLDGLGPHCPVPNLSTCALASNT